MGLSRTKKLILLMAGVSATFLIYQNRIRITAWAWHFRHSNIVIGTYSVPVPKNWYVEKLGDGDHLLVRLDTAQTPPTKRVKAHAGILLSVSQRAFSEDDLRRMMALEVAFLEKQGPGLVATRTFSLGNITVICAGGDRLNSGGINDVDATSWRCKGSGGLEMSITATEPDMLQIWGIISGIRKES